MRRDVWLNETMFSFKHAFLVLIFTSAQVALAGNACQALMRTDQGPETTFEFSESNRIDIPVSQYLRSWAYCNVGIDQQFNFLSITCTRHEDSQEFVSVDERSKSVSLTLFGKQSKGRSYEHVSLEVTCPDREF